MPTALFLLYNEISQVWQMSYIQQVNAAYLTDYLILCPILGTLWQYRLWSFKSRDIKLERFFALKSTYPNENY